MPQNNEILILAPHVSEKIAAGEVVDRPLSIAKELVENSIDAGADSIVVEIREGGKTYIRVTDNGIGIPSGHVKTAFLRHATSKIKDDRDLDDIGTLGFRGEALASIAAVSKVEIVTKTAQEKAGSRMIIEGGNVSQFDPTGCPDGTTIIVTDLFYNTPARLKFMKTHGAEGSLIIDFMSKMALAYPDIKFRVINNGVPLFATRGDGSIYNNILTVYSKQTVGKLIEIEENEGDYGIRAFISPPDVTKGNRRGQVYFVNGRNIVDKVLESAVSKAYRELVDAGRNPYVYLFLHVPNDSIDVNIHPNKKEIRFDNNARVSEFVTGALKKGLGTKEGLSGIRINNNPFVISDRAEKINVAPFKVDNGNQLYNRPSENDGHVDIISEDPGQADKIFGLSEQVDIKTLLVTKRQGEHARKPETVNMDAASSERLNIMELVPLGSIFATYILAVDSDRFYLIDQHAAHERVLYEKLLKQFAAEEKDTQLLLSPILLETSPAVFNNAETLVAKLSEIGFEIEPFGLRSFLVKGIPSFMEYDSAHRFLAGFSEDFDEAKNFVDEDKMNKIIIRSCKSAIKANNLLNIDDIRHLLFELSQAKNPLSCPHGRPTMLMLSSKDIERMFKR